MRILGNEVYVGDRLIQKQAPHNYLTKRPDPTVSYESRYMTDDHEPIISRVTWEQVKALLEQGKQERADGVHARGNAHFLYGKIFCAECGAPYKRRTITQGEKRYKAWNCAERQKGRRGNGCKNRSIREDELFQRIAESMGIEHFDEDRFFNEVIAVRIGADGISLQMRETA